MKKIKKIEKKDILKVFLRSNLIQGSWNFERMQALGFCYSISPIINKLYLNKKKKIKAIKRHQQFFNTHPYVASLILGVVIAIEERKSNGFFVKKNIINNVKIGLMGPLAGIGDPIFWGSVRPILAALFAGLAMQGNIFAPFLFFLVFNFIRVFFKYYGIVYGYNKGVNIINDVDNNLLNKITVSSSILGLFIIGALVSKWTKLKISLIVSNIKNIKGEVISSVSLQSILDQIMPGIIPLILTLFTMFLLNKKINPLYLIFLFFIIGIIGAFLGILS
ncbi:MAG: PTS mannose transporter subunit IID [Enterobacteriaceae bacterium]